MKGKSPGSDLDLQVLFLPRKRPLLELSLPHHSPSTTSAGAQSSRKGGWVGGWVWGSSLVPTRFIYFSSVKLYPHPLWSFCLPYLHPTLHTLSLPTAPPLPTSERASLRPIPFFFPFLNDSVWEREVYLQVTSESCFSRLTHGSGLLFPVKCRSPVTTSWLYKTKQV